MKVVLLLTRAQLRAMNCVIRALPRALRVLEDTQELLRKAVHPAARREEGAKVTWQESISWEGVGGD